jgi:prevent-host-death family protein
MAAWLERYKNEMKKIALNAVKNELSKYLHEAEKEDIIITKHGKPAGVLKGFKDEDEWIEYRIENDPEFLTRIERARKDVRGEKGTPIEKVK